MQVPVLPGEATIASFGESFTSAFRGDEILVVNDTRVVPARVRGAKSTGGAVEVLFLGALGDGRIEVLLGGKRIGPGARFRLPGTEAEIIERRPDGTATLELLDPAAAADPIAWLEAFGEVPLPPYIRREADADDRARYQTVYATQPGAVAAPTAGLHLTEPILDELRDLGIAIATITLHVSLGTFAPVRVDDLDAHEMHSERFTVPPRTAEALASGRPIVAVGTTVVRALESFAIDPHARATRLFIRPGFRFSAVDGLCTNFHLPGSTLLMLVCAFAGYDRVMDAYRQAVLARMRFFSYGDAMLVRRPDGRWRQARRARNGAPAE